MDGCNVINEEKKGWNPRYLQFVWYEDFWTKSTDNQNPDCSRVITFSFSIYNRNTAKECTEVLITT